ncbi:transcription factor Opi1-domain-containing protein [Pilobolus umbonatus]|nr:transcription factor Opi1-domain-containing protein [Pilobolus umbonatus]
MSQHSLMSINQLMNSEDTTAKQCDMYDADVKMAAEVLGDMARHTVKKPITLPPLSTPSTTPSSPLPTPTSSTYLMDNRLSFSSESTMEDIEQIQQRSHFMHRVSNIPIVNSALKVYENSKNANSVVKYGAEMVESFAAPICDKIGKHALSVDEWGCKQLDRLEERYPTYVVPKEEEEEDTMNSTAYALSRTSLRDDHERDIRRRRDSRDETYGIKNRSRNCSRSTSPHRNYGITKPTPTRHRQPIARSKWHQIVMHASSAAGTTAAVISEESMKCLRYCLDWLQYAAQHIDQQMNLLRKYLVSLASSPESSSTSVTVEDAGVLNDIKKEIVNTLRKVVEVITKYAGSGLPEQAKAAVRGFILALPTRWAVLNNNHTSDTLDETSIKLLHFGGESIEMIQSVSHVFSDTVERAELWISRLRVVAGNHQIKKQESAMEL